MNLDSILKEVKFNLNNDELNRVIEAVKYARAQNHRSAAKSFQVGDAVQFEGRGGHMERGSVQKINIKYVIVETGTGRWRVPAAHLQAA